MKFRRTPTSVALCELSCPLCTSPHLKKVINALKREKPVTFVLPAFPGKSPNPDKVLGTLPNMAEHRALCFLQELCDKIKSIYSPGAHIILCSDGRVFSDIVGMREDDVTDYQYELDQMIEELELKNISTFNLDALYKGNDFVQMRQHLMERFGKSLESLQEKVRQGGKHSKNPEDIEAHRMYLGITRFLLEDSLYPGQTKSRSALQKECRKKAYEVILRSNAWSELISCQMPNSVRLSIHPQICGAKKLGIRLVGSETWMTPWHGVAVKTNEGFILLKQTEAKALGARLVHSLNGRPSHYELATQHDQKF
ncbi:L-tyrosine/L-tryptophan isonitrile synthase family protein [Silvanigrella sp.]|uniref:L-tyrosine/L-tryptophan isonitrile synthase family protein n=1 Tax=Silvanigrella sp. TaxID=2024976 RepID=UPI0037C84E35